MIPPIISLPAKAKIQPDDGSPLLPSLDRNSEITPHRGEEEEGR
uniref:Uncharacterized protein n=1 Tax=Arundo donax TaxID=35708 RepID=A0A0A9FXN4_ARUDO